MLPTDAARPIYPQRHNVAAQYLPSVNPAHQKDAVENFLNREVCRGTMSLAEAQRQIATDWLAVYRQNGLKPQ